tara:strand:- start:7158 stop:9797 length:2640 start_codon:yes stop_codon:yes gene_type:complete
MHKTILLILLFTLIIKLNAHNFSVKEGFTALMLNDELTNPTGMAIAPDGRIFITERSGKVRILENDVLLSESFLEVEVDGNGERGLGAILLDPDFDENGYVYIYYTVEHEDHNRLSRFTANGNLAIPNSEVILLDFDELGGNVHNGGAMRWGSDGTLFIAVGDGLRKSTPQSLNSLLGKMIRINKDGSIPSDNPFYEELEGKYRSIYSLGLRNTFTFDIHPVTGQILGNDVGQDDFEEINDIQAGKNYGWPSIEGPISSQESPENYQDPLLAYPHVDGGNCAVVGGAFYAPETIQFPENWKDFYLFSDYCTGVIHKMDPMSGEILDTLVVGAHVNSNLMVGPDGYVYYLMYQSGEIWQIQYVGDGSPFISRQPSTKTAVVGEDVQLEVNVIGNDPLSYEWFKNNELINDEDSATLTLRNIELSDSNASVYCKITNQLGFVFSDTLYLDVTQNQRPEIHFTTPSQFSTYNDGDTLKFKGFATDEEDGTIDVNQLEWWINFHHEEHFHPGMEITTGISEGSFYIPRLGETSPNVWYRVHLRATDNNGLTNESFIDVQPEVVNTIFKTLPSSLQLNIDGAHKTTAFNFNGVKGSERVLIAPQFQNRNDSLYEFEKWSDGTTDYSKVFYLGDFPEIRAEYKYIGQYIDGDGSGLKAAYYNNFFFNGDPTVERIDPFIDFYPDYGNFADVLPSDSVSVIWSGSILAPVTSSYTFTFEYDDHVEVNLNGVDVLISNDQLNGGERSISVNLNAGVKYNLIVKYKEDRWLSKIKMFWQNNYQEKQIVPRQFLYPDSSEIVHSKFLTHENPHAFPNPTNSLINIVSNDSTPFKIVLFNSQGQYLTEIKYPHQTSIATINVGHFTDGIYYFQILSDKKKTVGKFLKISH